MKKFNFFFYLFVIVIGSSITLSFIDVQHKKENNTELFHWFESETGVYLGFDTKKNVQDNHCGFPGNQECAFGYYNIDTATLYPVGISVVATTRQ